MEVRRLYDREKRLIMSLILAGVFLIFTGILLIAKIKGSSFKDYLIDKNYEKLYTFIENPDFTYNIFNTYMDYNYGGDIKIINTEKKQGHTKYTIATDTGEKSIVLEEKDGTKFWAFNDYVYDWEINVPKSARLFIENMEFENIEGKVKISKLPFAVYQVRINADNCIDYNEKVLAGQKLGIKMDIDSGALKVCREVINQYIDFKSNAINFKVINDISCVEKDSGIYKEVIEQVDWLKNIDYKISKVMSSLTIEKCWMDFDGIICVALVEVWDTTIINENGENITTDKYKNIYYINPKDNFKIVKIKNQQV